MCFERTIAENRGTIDLLLIFNEYVIHIHIVLSEGLGGSKVRESESKTHKTKEKQSSCKYAKEERCCNFYHLQQI